MLAGRSEGTRRTLVKMWAQPPSAVMQVGHTGEAPVQHTCRQINHEITKSRNHQISPPTTHVPESCTSAPPAQSETRSYRDDLVPAQIQRPQGPPSSPEWQ